MRRAALVLAACFAALSVAVALGVLDGVDRYAVRQLMPGLDAAHSGVPTLGQVFVPVGHRRTPGALAADAWLYPASVPISALAVGACSLVLLRRGRRRAAAVWLGAWVAANAVEVLVKDVVRKPALSARGYHVVAFDSSFPSGHALRSILVAAALAAVAVRAGRWAAVWAVTVVPLLVVAGWHTPSDVAGGVLLGLFFVAAARLAAAER